MCKKRIDPNKLEKDEFLKRIKGAVYICSFINKELEPDINSTYAKLLTVNLERILKKYNIDLYLASPRM